MPRFNSTRVRERNATAIQQARERERERFEREFRRYLEVTHENHTQQVVKLRHNLNEVLQMSAVLSASLDDLEAENRKLKRRLGQLEGFVRGRTWEIDLWVEDWFARRFGAEGDGDRED